MNKIKQCMNKSRQDMNKNKSEQNICTNCEKLGHLFHQCKLPIISYGIIAIHENKKENKYEYLMIRRKDSFGYIDFIRGKYSLYNIDRIKQCIDGMSLDEKQRLRTHSFEECWKMLWGREYTNQYKNEEMVSQKKFHIIKSGMNIGTNHYTLDTLLDDSNTQWTEQEWEFPKGRRNLREKELVCAMREFSEETGIPSSRLNIINNLVPFEELFIGSNHRAYKHKYYLGFIETTEKENNLLDNYQESEVSKLEWKNIHNCLESIRDDNLEKKRIIQHINKVLEEYTLYS
jgi:8-oxo-dGTP pyrophosphatase MutT (NUDIX family)|tara:strand:- start:9329 stop:10192 length:864 start_codon:yes stop_codon:yes gene_type:complete